MEEDQEAQLQRENQGSLAGAEGEGSEGNGAARSNNEHHSFMCHTCNKGFSSGKALGGHMRIHNLSRKQVHRAKQGHAKPKTNKWLLVSGAPTCSLCWKSFSSMKSLFGHMRSHPERVRKGIVNNTLHNGASSNSTCSSTLSDDSTFDLSQALRGCWSVTAKRGRRSPSSSNANSGLEDDDGIEPRMQEAVYELMLLASGDPKREEKLDDDDQIEEKPSDQMGCEEELFKPVFGNCGDMMVKKVMKKKKGVKKMRLRELETAEEGKKLVRCRICNTTFPSQKALEGHLCSHQNSNNIQVVDEPESDYVSGTVDETGIVLAGGAVEAKRGYQCKIFNKTLSIGQAFGDNKRSNWTGMAEATSSLVENGQNCSKILSFDLNQLPAMDGEEGVQSDFFIPANTTISSSYDSSS